MILDTPWPDIIARGVLLAIAAIIWVVVLIRLNGLRSLSTVSYTHLTLPTKRIV